MNCQAPSVYSPARSAHPSDAVRNTTTSSGTTVSVTKLIVNIELSFSPRCSPRRWHNPSQAGLANTILTIVADIATPIRLFGGMFAHTPAAPRRRIDSSRPLMDPLLGRAGVITRVCSLRGSRDGICVGGRCSTSRRSQFAWWSSSDHGEAAPAARGAVEHRPHQADGAGLAWESADHLGAPLSRPETAHDEIGRANPGMVFDREPQIRGQSGPVCEQDPHRRRI